VGLSSVSATSGSIWVAEEKGLFKKHGIDAEVIIIGGARRAWSALCSLEKFNFRWAVAMPSSVQR